MSTYNRPRTSKSPAKQPAARVLQDYNAAVEMPNGTKVTLGALVNTWEHTRKRQDEELCAKEPVRPSITKAQRCDIKAKSQPHFTLLAQDNFTSVLVNEWIRLAIEMGAPAALIGDARVVLMEIEEWRRHNPMKCKTPN